MEQKLQYKNSSKVSQLLLTTAWGRVHTLIMKVWPEVCELTGWIRKQQPAETQRWSAALSAGLRAPASGYSSSSEPLRGAGEADRESRDQPGPVPTVRTEPTVSDDPPHLTLLIAPQHGSNEGASLLRMLRERGGVRQRDERERVFLFLAHCFWNY